MSNTEKRNESIPENGQNRPPMESEIWIPPDDTPDWVLDKMPVEEVAHSDIVWEFFFKDKPEWWNSGYGMAVVNNRRKQVYELWQSGELEDFSEPEN